MGRQDEYYWMDSYGSQLVNEHKSHINLLIADFVRTAIDKTKFPEAEQMKEDVLAGMVEAQESMREFHFDNWR